VDLNMSKLKGKIILFCAGLIMLNTAYAQSGSGGEFTIYNSTSNNIVIGFYTNDGGGWSSNWLETDLNPGEDAAAYFSADTGSCDQAFQVGWLGDGDTEVLDDSISIDICEASNIYLEDNEIYFD
jgi:hypothetical protein